MFKKSFHQKLAISLLLLSLTFVLISPVLWIPQPARAVSPFVAIINTAKTVWDATKDVVATAYKHLVPVLFKNGVNLVLNNMARDTANYLAGGAKGQKPAFLSDPNYWTKMGDAAGGEFINTLAQSTGFVNQNLCDPIDPTIKLKMLTKLNADLSKETLLRNFTDLDKTKKGIWDPEKACSLSKIDQRLKEASKKKLFAFDIDLREGPLKKYLTDLTVLIATDTKIVDTPAKTDLQIICGKIESDSESVYEHGLAKQQITVQEIIQQIKEIAKIKESEKIKIKNNIKDVLIAITAYRANEEEVKANNYPARMVDGGFSVHPLDYYSKVSQYCLTQNKEELIKIEAEGYQECKKMVDYLSCSSDDTYSSCREMWKRIKLYSNQAITWQEQLAQLTKSLIDEEGRLVLPNEEVAISLADAQRALSPENSDIGIELSMSSNLDSFITNKVTDKQTWDQINTAGGITSMNTAISNVVKTPAALVKKAGEKNIENADTSLKTYTGDLLADTANVFMGTLMSQLVKQIFEKGFNKETNPDSVINNESGLFNTTSQLTKKSTNSLFTGLSRVNLKQGGEVNVLEELMICPENSKYRQVNNCVIDQKFAQAIRQQKTIKQAVTDGDIDLSLDKNNIDEILTKIKILRANRIVPLGLEIAANLMKKNDLLQSQYSLEQIIEGFDIEGNDFYHLVDPNWVLKAPASRCQIMGYGNLPLYGSTERQEVCIDRQNCIDEAEDGSCNTYGYCVAEKKIWRFQGDSCDQQFTSCSGYQRQSDGQPVYYLTDTLDNRDCDEQSAGCQQYTSNYVLDSGSWIDRVDANGCPYPGGCLCQIPALGNCIVKEGETNCTVINENDCDLTQPHLLYFNRQTEECNVKAVGCHEYLRTKADLGTNLVLNNSFTDFIGEVDGGLARENIFDLWTKQGINSAGQSMIATYAVSNGYQDRQAIKVIAGQQEIAKGINQIITITPQNYPRYFIASAYINNQEDFIGVWNLSIQAIGSEIIAGDNQWNQDNYDWQRYWQAIKVPANTGEIILFIGTSFQDLTAQGAILIDGVQLVETSQPIADEFDLPELTDYGQVNQIYLRQSPTEIDCNINSDSYSSLDCANYALTCQSADVGCQLYSSNVGTNKIPAVVNPNDSCPSECVGYDYYYQSATLFESENIEVPLIPNGQICSAQEVGCEEFTNLEKLTQGGEAKEYYSYIRPCQKPDDTCQSYYTWVGSDIFGYQLKKYTLRADGANGPAKVFSIDETNGVYGQCVNESDAKINPHCRIFYDNAGDIYPTIFEATITCSESCQQLRKTSQIEVTDCWQSLPNSAIYNATTGICTFSALPEQSRRCSASSVGCREYKGNNANQVINILSDDFESGNLDDTPVNWTIGSISSASIQFPGKSLYVAVASTGRSLEATDIAVGESYLATFWAKGSGSLNVSFDNGQTFNSVSVILTNQWQSYRLGPVVVSGNLPTEIIFNGFNDLYLDNFVLQQSPNLYFIKDSWQIPDSCVDTTIGCQAYYDATKQTHYLTGFSHLCSDQSVGCEEVIDTYNSSPATELTFNQDSDSINDDIIIPADNKVYLVNDAKKYCLATDKGCQRFGLASYDANGQVSGYQDVYLKNDPDKYNSDRSILCQQQQQNCAEFAPIGGSGNSVYFKDPTVNHQLCEYREGAVIAGQVRNGWFKLGTNQTCYDNSYTIKDLDEAGYSGQVGICPSQQVNCTKFSDPDAEQDYYYLKNNQLDETSCQGRVSKKEGCILFKDHSNPYNYYVSTATYDNSSEELIIPVNADNTEDIEDTNDTNIILKVRPDRVCAQWEWCKNSFVQQLDGGQTQSVCSQLGLCNQLAGHGSNAQCIGWETNSPFLDKTYYTTERNVSYSGGIDYSGIAIADQYLPDQLQINYEQNANYFYLNSVKQEGINGVNCSNNNDCSNGSICQDDKCILLQTTRAYAEKDAPFTNLVRDIYYQQVNYCQSDSCQNSYYKVGYGTKGMEKRYFDIDDETIFTYICSELDENNEVTNCEKSGKKDDATCSNLDLGNCIARSKTVEHKVENWLGYCLERAPNYDQRVAPCLTWLPINVGMDRDLHNPDTGYSLLSNQQWYCVEASVNKDRIIPFTQGSNTIYSGQITGGSECSGSYRDGIHIAHSGSGSPVCANNIILNESSLYTLPYFVVKRFRTSQTGKDYQYANCYYTRSLLYDLAKKYFEVASTESCGAEKSNVLLLRASSSVEDNKIKKLTAKIEGERDQFTHLDRIRFDTRPCQTLVKVPVNENGMAIAYTNRINNLQYTSVNDTDKRLRIYDKDGGHINGLENSQSLYQDLVTINTSLTDTTLDQLGALYYRQHLDGDGNYYQLYDWLGNQRGYVTGEKSEGSTYYHFADLFPRAQEKGNLIWDDTNAKYDIDDATGLTYGVRNIDPVIEIPEDKNAINSTIGLPYQLSFYAWADADKMPIQKIIIDWGDETQEFNSLTAMNHKKMREIDEAGIVIEAGCDSSDFGSLAEQTCVERPFIFQHAYTTTGIFNITVTVWDNWADVTAEDSGDGDGIIISEQYVVTVVNN